MQLLDILPPRARAAFIGGGTIVMGFSSQLANVLQQVGLALGFAFLIFGIADWVYHYVKKRRAMGLPLVEPSQLIAFGLIGAAFCLLIAGGGYIWQLAKPGGPALANTAAQASIGRDGPFVFGADIGNSGKADEPIVFIGRVKQTQKLSFYVQYVTTISGPQWYKSELIPLDAKEILRDTPISIPVITRRIEPSNGTPRFFWGKSQYPVGSSTNVYVLLSVVVIGPDGHEQVVRSALHHQEADTHNEEKFSSSPMYGFPYIAEWLNNSDKTR